MEGCLLLACVRSEQSQLASQASGRQHTHLNSILRSRDSSRSSHLQLQESCGTKLQGQNPFTFPYYLTHVQNPQMQGVSKVLSLLLILSSH